LGSLIGGKIPDVDLQVARPQSILPQSSFSSRAHITSCRLQPEGPLIPSKIAEHQRYWTKASVNTKHLPAAKGKGHVGEIYGRGVSPCVVVITTTAQDSQRSSPYD